MSPRSGLRVALALALCSMAAPRARADTDGDFLAAVSTGDAVKAGTLLVQGADVDARDVKGRAALIVAAGRGDLAMVQLLLDHSAAVSAQDPEGFTALAVAAGAASASAARLLLEYGADANARTRDGKTPLMLAARAGDVSTVRELLFHGAAVNAADADGATALMYAARSAPADVVRALLDAGAKVDARDRRGRTALFFAKNNNDAATGELFSGRPAPKPKAAAVAAKPVVTVSTAGAKVLLGAGPEPEAEEALREAYLRFFERDPSDPISLETAETLRVSSAAIIPKDLKGRYLAETDGKDIFLNMGWLLALYTGGPSDGSDELEGYRKSFMNAWLNDPEELDDFVARTASLIVHEAGHIRYGEDLHGESFEDYWQDLQCRYRQVLFLRHRVRSEPDFLGLRDYDALMRQRLKEPPSGRPWWSDPLPDGFNERFALDLDQSLRHEFPGRFDYSLEWSWYRMRLLNDGLDALKAHMLKEVRGEYADPWANGSEAIADLKKDIAKNERWLREHKKPDPGDPWIRRIVEMALDVDKSELEIGSLQEPSPAYRAYFALENTRLEGMLAQELYSYRPGPAWRSSALGPPSKKAPPLALKHLLNAPVKSVAGWGALRGNLVLLEFWATWCGPCQATIPHMNALVKAMRGKPVRIISVTEEDPRTVEPFLKRHPMLAWVDAEGDQALSELYGISMIPAAFLVDKDGTLIEPIDPRTVTPRLLEDLLAGKRPDVLAEETPIRDVASDDGETQDQP